MGPDCFMSATVSTSIVPLTGGNYATWRIQCQMALMKEGLWGMVNDTEVVPDTSESLRSSEYITRKNKALATIVLTLDPSILYLIGEPEDPRKVWFQLRDQFQKKTWANKLALKRQLLTLTMNNGESLGNHIKLLTEIFNELSLIGAPMDEEDRVVHLLASLPSSYNMIVTALEACAEVPKMEIVTERLLHEEKKIAVRTEDETLSNRALWLKEKNGPQCYKCKKYGHIKRNCPMVNDIHKHKTRRTQATRDSSVESVGLVAENALTTVKEAKNWIIDSGATSHMCCDKNEFNQFSRLEEHVQISLGDGRNLSAHGRGSVKLKMRLPGGKSQLCTLHDVLYIPELKYNLFSVGHANDAG